MQPFPIIKPKDVPSANAERNDADAMTTIICLVPIRRNLLSLPLRGAFQRSPYADSRSTTSPTSKLDPSSSRSLHRQVMAVPQQSEPIMKMSIASHGGTAVVSAILRAFGIAYRWPLTNGQVSGRRALSSTRLDDVGSRPFQVSPTIQLTPPEPTLSAASSTCFVFVFPTMTRDEYSDLFNKPRNKLCLVDFSWRM